MLERPITTASSPSSDGCTVFARMTQPSGVQGASAGRPADRRPALIGMEAVDILGRIDRGEHLLRIDLRGQRQLHQDAVHDRIGVEPPDQRQQFGLAGRLRQAVIERAHAAADGRLGLAGDIDLARRVVADQHHREPRHQAAVARQPMRRVRDLAAQLRRDRLAVDDPRGHAAMPPCRSNRD